MDGECDDDETECDQRANTPGSRTSKNFLKDSRNHD